MLFSVLVVVFVLAKTGMAWGPIGHRIITQLAYSRLSPHAQSALDALLATQRLSLAQASTWADDVLYSGVHSYDWSKPLHYIQAGQSMAEYCGIQYAQDCPKGKCVVGAIANYTTRVAKCNLDQHEFPGSRALSLLFLIHFFTDRYIQCVFSFFIVFDGYNHV